MFIEPKFIHDASSVAHIEDLVVDSEYRRFGIGKTLVRKAIEIAKLAKSYKIILDCDSKNVPFYNNLGFGQRQVQMSYYI